VGNVHGRFSENGFHMFKREKEVIFHAYEAVTVEFLRENIKLTTLSDIYNDVQSYIEIDKLLYHA